MNTNNTEILIGDIGESNREGLFCHTDLLTCCRIADNVNGSGNGQGKWFYPNGSMVNRELIALTNREGFYSRRREQSVRLDRFQATNVLSPTGSFCCTVPTTVGDMIFCANLGMRLLWEAHLHAFDVHAVVCLSLPPLANGTIVYSDTLPGVASVANHTCDDGYQLRGESSRQCQSNSSWSGSTPVCIGRMPNNKLIP